MAPHSNTARDPFQFHERFSKTKEHWEGDRNPNPDLDYVAASGGPTDPRFRKSMFTEERTYERNYTFPVKIVSEKKGRATGKGRDIPDCDQGSGAKWPQPVSHTAPPHGSKSAVSASQTTSSASSGPSKVTTVAKNTTRSIPPHLRHSASPFHKATAAKDTLPSIPARLRLQRSAAQSPKTLQGTSSSGDIGSRGSPSVTTGKNVSALARFDARKTSTTQSGPPVTGQLIDLEPELVLNNSLSYSENMALLTQELA